MILSVGAIAIILLSLIVFLLGWEVKRMKDAIAALVSAINDNTAAVNAAIKAGFADPADAKSITDAATTLAATTAALVATTPAPAP